MTQQQIARHFGISRPTVAQWEAGTHRPDQDKFPDLAGVLGVTLDWLMSEEGSGPALGIPKPPTSSKFLKTSRHKFYVSEWRVFMVGDKVDGAARVSGLGVNEYLAHETHPINFTLGQVAALADEFGIRGDQFWFPPPKVKSVSSAAQPKKQTKKKTTRISR